MEVNHVPARVYYCAEKTLTPSEIPDFAGKALEMLCRDAESRDLDVSGPPEFFYFTCTDDNLIPLHLIVAVPVLEGGSSRGGFFFMESMPFDCVSVLYKGSMSTIGIAWEDLVQQALKMGYLLSNQGREVYREWVSFESEDNVTELQMGIAGRKVG